MIAVDALIAKDLFGLYCAAEQVLLELDLLIGEQPHAAAWEGWLDARGGVLNWLAEYDYASKFLYPPFVDGLWLDGLIAIDAGLEAIHAPGVQT